MIRRIQGGLNHLGQRPGKNPENPEDSRLGELQRQLAQAIDQEEYEKAAGLRDEIRALKGKGEGHDNTVE